MLVERKKEININNDFLIELNEPILYTKELDDNLLTIIKADVLNNEINTSDINCSIGFTLKKTFDQDNQINQIDINNFIFGLYKKGESSTISQMGNGSKIIVHGNFRKIHKVLIDESSLKVGYYTMRILTDDAMGKLQLTKYIGIVMTKKACYFCNIRYDFINGYNEEIEKFIEMVLSNIKLMED